MIMKYSTLDEEFARTVFHKLIQLVDRTPIGDFIFPDGHPPDFSLAAYLPASAGAHFNGQQVVLSLEEVLNIGKDCLGHRPSSSLGFFLEKLMHECFHAVQSKASGMSPFYHSNYDIEKFLHVALVIEADAHIRTIWGAEELRRGGITSVVDYWSGLKPTDPTTFSSIAFPIYQQVIAEDPSAHDSGKAANYLVLSLLNYEPFVNAQIQNYIETLHENITRLISDIRSGLDVRAKGFGVTNFRYMEGDNLSIPNLIEIGKFRGTNLFNDPKTGSAEWIMSPDFLNFHISSGRLQEILVPLRESETTLKCLLGLTPESPNLPTAVRSEQQFPVAQS
jgi:hypothetical protein